MEPTPNTTLTTQDPPKQSTSESNISGEILLIMLLTVILISLSNLLKKYKLNKYINEPFLSLVIGVLAGCFLHLTENEVYINDLTSAFNKFFIILILPPIIFESGYKCNRPDFFKNIGTILIFAILGTWISVASVAVVMLIGSTLKLYTRVSPIETLAYSSWISATDPVSIISSMKEYETDPEFYIVIFGESMWNDAVSLVWYNTCVDYKNESLFSAFVFFFIVLIGSTWIGFCVGYVTAIALKVLGKKVNKIERIEISLLLLLPWVSYLIAELLGLCGIVAILFNGISLSMYAKPNWSDYADLVVNMSYETVVGLCEWVVFVFMGIGFFSFENLYRRLSPVFVVYNTLNVVFGRLLGIIVCSYLVNWTRGRSKWNDKKILFLWFAGIRGAMAFAISINTIEDFPGLGKIFLAFTLIFITITVSVASFGLEFVLKKCEVIVTCKDPHGSEVKVQEREKGKPAGEEDNGVSPRMIKYRNCFDKVKALIRLLNDNYLLRFVVRDKEGSDREDVEDKCRGKGSGENEDGSLDRSDHGTNEVKVEITNQRRSDGKSAEKNKYAQASWVGNEN